MSTSAQHTRSGLLGGAALLLVLLGVLAMHGIGGHAGGHGPASEPLHGAGHHGSVATAGMTPAALLSSTVSVVADPGEHATSGERSAGEWTALCLAVLVGAALLLLVRRATTDVRVSPGPTGAGTRPPGRRDRDPPSLDLLSVRRC